MAEFDPKRLKVDKHTAQEINTSLVQGNLSYHEVTKSVCEIVENELHRNWYVAFGTVSYTHLTLPTILRV